jgi:hypothetical protein
VACGPGKIGDWLVPDWLFALNMRRCCQDHDNAYASPGNLTRKEVDRMFLRCLLHKIALNQIGNRRTMIAVAYTYYWAVRIGGWFAWRRAARKA